MFLTKCHQEGLMVGGQEDMREGKLSISSSMNLKLYVQYIWDID